MFTIIRVTNLAASNITIIVLNIPVCTLIRSNIIDLMMLAKLIKITYRRVIPDVY